VGKTLYLELQYLEGSGEGNLKISNYIENGTIILHVKGKKATGRNLLSSGESVNKMGELRGRKKEGGLPSRSKQMWSSRPYSMLTERKGKKIGGGESTHLKGP